MMFSDLQRELEVEILSRVPATSLIKLQTTCKRWYALFKDQSFINKNLRNATKTQVVVLQDDFGVHSVSINLNDPSIEFTGKLNSVKDSEPVDILDIFHCDGLLLCTTLDDRLVVWNPCTGQTRWIKPSSRKKQINVYVLGQYENNRYKILRYSLDVLPHCNLEFEIYDFNTDSWRILDNFNKNWYIHNDPLGVGVCLRGNTYWVAGDDEDPLNILFLLKFDFKTERFERLSLPFDSNYDGVDVRLLAVRQEKLFVLILRLSMDSKSIEVWVTDTKIDEAKGTKIQYFFVADLGKVNWMPLPEHVNCFLVENEMVVCCDTIDHEILKGTTTIYMFGDGDHNIHVRKQVHIRDLTRGPSYWQSLVNYVPSLTQIQQLESLKRKRSLIS